MVVHFSFGASNEALYEVYGFGHAIVLRLFVMKQQETDKRQALAI